MQAALQALDPNEWTPEALERFRKTQRESLRKRRAAPIEAAESALARIQALDLRRRLQLRRLAQVASARSEWVRTQSHIGKRLAGQLEGRCLVFKASASTAARIQDAIPAIEQAAQAWRDLYEGESGREFKLEEHLQQRVSIGTLGLIRDELAAVEREKRALAVHPQPGNRRHCPRQSRAVHLRAHRQPVPQPLHR